MKIITYFYIYFYMIERCLNYVVYPLKTIGELDTIEKFLSFDSTYTTLEIGTPPQKVNFYLTLNHYKMFITNIECKKSNLFNITKSKSFNMLGEVQQNDEKKNSIVVVLDTIYFYDNINLTIKLKMEEFPLYFSIDYSKENQNICGSLGLSNILLEKNINQIPEDFEYYLKYLRTQNNYFSFFNYKGEDYIVNSVFLHQEFKDFFYNVQNISWIYPIVKENSLLWEISMKEIYYNNIHFKNKIIFDLNPIFELIVGNDEYKINIQRDFFNSFINKKICLIRDINNYKVIECNANKFTNKDINNFPTLYIYNNDLNHIFEMPGKDLFNKLNNKYYFNIVFPIKNSENNKWVIGKIFFRKYPVIFSPKNRIIGFYIKPNEGMIAENKENSEMNNYDKNTFTKNIQLYIIIVIIALIFTCVGLYIGKKIFFPKFKKAKELTDEYYEYDSKENYNKKEGKNENNKSFSSIEMNSKLESK